MNYNRQFTDYIKACSLPSKVHLKRILYVFVLSMLFLLPAESMAEMTYTISKSNNAPNPIATGQPFTYTLTYSWTGGAPGTLYITDNVPADLDVLSALPGSPTSTISGNTVTFAISGLSLPSGSGTVQINARFKPGITCGGVTVCNVAYISHEPKGDKKKESGRSCVTSAEPTLKWSFQKDVIAGCALDDEVIYRICVTRPSGSDIGGLNLIIDSLEDLLPANAKILGVTSYWSGPTNVVSTGTWINLTGGPTILPVSPYASWYCTYVRVKFPSANFTVGQSVDNIAKLTYHTPCDPEPKTMIDTATVVLCEGVTQGYLYKGLTLGISFPNNPAWAPNFSPGCCGTYRLQYTNNGTLAQDNFVMEDIVPGHVDVSAIKTNVPIANVPVKVEVFTWSGSSCGTTPAATFIYNTAGMQTETTLPANICRVKWTYDSTIAVSQTLQNFLDVCVRTTNFKTGAAVVAGQTIQNTVTAVATGLPIITVNHDKVVDITKPNVVATKIFTGDCAPGCNINPNGPFMPGDTVRYRMAVANIGTDDATLATITDVLPTGFSYVGNESYFYGAFNWMANAYNPSCCSFNATVPSEIGGSITSPTVGATTLNWSFPVLPSRCDGTVEYFLIEFDVVLSASPPVLAGQHSNTFDFAASNVPALTSNVAYMTVNAIAQVQALKEVRKQGSTGDWSNSANIEQNGVAEYKLTIKNTGNTPLTDVCLLDIMPWVGDITVMPPYAARNSTFNLPYNPVDGAISITPAGFTDSYNTLGVGPQRNPSRASECGGFCGVTDPAGATVGSFGAAVNTYSYKVSANPSTNLAPGASLEVIVPVRVNGETKIGESACNSFAMQATPLGLQNVCLSTESNPACITVTESKPCLEIKDTKVDCIGVDQNGNPIYNITTNMYSSVGYTTIINIVSPDATITNIQPPTLNSDTLTKVTFQFTTTVSVGKELCFTVVLTDKKGNKVCQEKFCVVIPECKDKCPCPFDIRIGDKKAYQGNGNQIIINNPLSVSGATMQNVRATVISATVNQYCFFGGGSTAYNAAAVFNSAAPWGPVAATGIGTSSINWNNQTCPPLDNFNPNMVLNVPNAPRFGCYQRVRICIRYEFTDCKCNVCDTVVCYDITRKAKLIVFEPWTPHTSIKGMVPNIDNDGMGNIDLGAINTIPVKENKLMASEAVDNLTIEMTDNTKGTLTINNPIGDEYTYGINIVSLYVSTSDGVTPTKLTSQGSGWSAAESTDDGLKIDGKLKPGTIGKFNIEYTNDQKLTKWTNFIGVAYTVEDGLDTLYGMVQLTSRIPSAKGGDILVNTKPGNKVENARTFALRFTNSNITKDSIGKVVMKVKGGAILAVGPGLDSDEFVLEGFKPTNGEITLLASTPAPDKAAMTALHPSAVVGPIYVTVASDKADIITIEFKTYSTDGSVITENELELTNPVSGVELQDVIFNSVSSSFYPNPATNELNVTYNMNKASKVRIAIRDVTGRELKVVQNSVYMTGGEHNLNFETINLPSGVYFYTIETDAESHSQRFVIEK